jgi:hypothetical protein
MYFNMFMIAYVRSNHYDVQMINVEGAEHTAGYFAQVMDAPWIVKQERLDELHAHMGDSASPDFDLATYLDPASGEVTKVGRLFALPFRLSLGLHEAVPREVDEEATMALYGIYKATKPPELGLKGHKLEYRQAQRASAAVMEAFIGAAGDRVYDDVLDPAFDFAKRQKLLIMPHRMNVKAHIRYLRGL